VSAEAILRAIYKEGTKDLEEGEGLVCVDISLIKKPYSKALEGLNFIGAEKSTRLRTHHLSGIG